MVTSRLATRAHLLARAAEPRGGRRWNRGLAQQLFCVGSGRGCFVTRKVNAGGLHFVCPGFAYAIAATSQVPCVPNVLVSMERTESTAARSLEMTPQAMVGEVWCELSASRKLPERPPSAESRQLVIIPITLIHQRGSSTRSQPQFGTTSHTPALPHPRKRPHTDASPHPETAPPDVSPAPTSPTG